MTSRRHKAPLEARSITIRHDGESIPAYEGEPLAAALMAAGIRTLSRSAKYHRPRGTSCGSGDCAHCLVTVDDLPNRCACSTPCRDGMVSRSQNVLGSAEHDLLGITDWMFPWGLDHHEMFTGVPLLQPVIQKVVRKLSGLGVLNESAESKRLRASELEGTDKEKIGVEVDVLVIGAGPSGLAAAETAAKEGASVLLVEAQGFLGGRLTSGIHESPNVANEFLKRLDVVRAQVWTDAGAVQASARQVLILGSDGLRRVRHKALVLACGGYGATGLFENNDLPGVVAAEWAARLLTRWGVLVGERPLICADEPAASSLARLFSEAKAPPIRVLPLLAAYAPTSPEPPSSRLIAAKGSRSVERVVIETDGNRETLTCDSIIVASPPAPAFELALEAGAKVGFEPLSGGFAVAVDELGRTSVTNVFACGTLTGPCSIERARSTGELAGSSAAAFVKTAEDGERSTFKEDEHAS